MPQYKLGKLPARLDSVKLKFSDYQTKLSLPKSYGNEKLVSNWGMLGNDEVGDCVLAGAGHETILWNREASKTVSISSQNAISDYSSITGYTPTDPSSDKGTDMQAAASYRLKTGIIDSKETRHKIGAYVSIEAGNVNQIKQAIYQFSAVGIGIQFPSSAMTQFNEGKNWTLVKGSKIEGGHYIPAVGYDSKYLYIITWGKCIKASWEFIKVYMDEGLVYLSDEFLKLGVSPAGFDITQLTSDLKSL